MPVLIDESDDDIVDQSITLKKKEAVLIQRQIVLYVDSETFERILKTRNVNTLHVGDNEQQLYLDDASICLIVEKEDDESEG